MPKKKKTKKKITIANTILLVGASVVVVALVYSLTKYFVEERQSRQHLAQQKVRLDAAEGDINDLAHEIIAQMNPAEFVDKTFSKDCAESSVKYGTGTITCGPSFSLTLYSKRPLDELRSTESLMSNLVVGNAAYQQKRAPYIDDGKYTSGRLFSLRTTYSNSEKTDCYFKTETYLPEQYANEFRDKNSEGSNVLVVSAGCNEVTNEPIYPLVN